MAFFLRVAAVKSARSLGSPGRPQEPKPDMKDLEEARKDLQGLAEVMPHVAVRALNKSLTGTKTDMVKVIREDYNYKAAALNKRITVARASRAKIEGHVQSRGGMVHLTDIAGTRQTKKGVTVNVRKSTGRQLIPRAFIRSGKNSGKKIVFRRKEENGQMVPRYPIEARSTAHPEILYNAEHNWAKISRAAAKRLDTNIGREIDAEFRRQQGKWK